MAAAPSSLGIEGEKLPEVAWLRQPALPFGVRLVRATQLVAVVVLRGEVDIHSASRFRDVVAAGIEGGVRAVVVDLSAVSFIDGAGLGVIVLTARRLGPGAVALVLPHRGLVRVFRICGLDRLLAICETREEALRGLLEQGSTVPTGLP